MTVDPQALKAQLAGRPDGLEAATIYQERGQLDPVSALWCLAIDLLRSQTRSSVGDWMVLGRETRPALTRFLDELALPDGWPCPDRQLPPTHWPACPLIVIDFHKVVWPGLRIEIDEGWYDLVAHEYKEGRLPGLPTYSVSVNFGGLLWWYRDCFACPAA